MATEPRYLPIATAANAHQNAELYRHDLLHPVLSVSLGKLGGPHVRVFCPEQRSDCAGLMAIRLFRAGGVRREE